MSFFVFLMNRRPPRATRPDSHVPVATLFRSHSPIVVLCPNRPQKRAGMRIEPPVSVPRAKPHRPAATATAEPLDEPPGNRWTVASQGFHGVPRASLTPVAPRANQTVLVFPRITQPAALSCPTTGAPGPVRCSPPPLQPWLVARPPAP